jgi:hypothetical protein
MAQIETPDRGQPLDISYLSRIVQEINTVSAAVSNAANIAKIKFRDIATPSSVQVANTMFYAETQKINDGNLSTQTTSNSVSFDFSGLFKTTPIVTCSVSSVSGVSKLIPVLKSVSQNSCLVEVFSTITEGTFSAEVSIIAIGERIST